jgi:hypothetical protein|tara:strand:- start:454 stop:1578 length:1125 start_codon:yes stop_codon:yes gene_type:complete
MANHKHDPDSIIKILKTKIPANTGTRLYAGYCALKKLEGKKYQAFRDVVGAKPRRPRKDDRAFSPADTIRHAIDNGYAKLVSSGDELSLRMELLARAGRDDIENLSPSVLREMGIYGGAQGIWVDKDRTSNLSSDGVGITVGILHTGRHYPDDLSEEGMIYHYPDTNRGGMRDANEVQATKNTKQFNLPLFVILPGTKNQSKRHLKLGWVENWDDDGKLFLISFGEDQPQAPSVQEPDEPFNLEDKSEGGTAKTKTRPNQQRFRFNVLQQYGHKCAVCSIKLPQLLIAAHIRGKEDKGSDDWRNGIPLCATHHKAFDDHLFSIGPEDLSVVISSENEAKDMGIDVTHLELLHNKPHQDALNWRWSKAQKAWLSS